MEEKQITLQIDGHFITVPEGSTILEAEKEQPCRKDKTGSH